MSRRGRAFLRSRSPGSTTPAVYQTASLVSAPSSPYALGVVTWSVESGADDEGSPFQPVRRAGSPRDRGSSGPASGTRGGPDRGTRRRCQPERREEAQGPDGPGPSADHGVRSG